MATEILRPQDSLIHRIRVPPCRRRNFHYHGHGHADNTGNGNANYYPSNNSSSTSSSSSSSSSNPRFNRKPADHQRKRHQPEPSISKRSTSADDLRISSSKNNQHRNNHHHQGHGHSHSLVMDKVTILRRGESLDSRTVAEATVVASGTERIGPCPEAVPRQIKITDSKPLPPPPPAGGSRKCDVYAGSAFAVSPAPSALPLPSFSTKKQVSVDDSATRDLRRLLRLDL